jgi:hypothetical protein
MMWNSWVDPGIGGLWGICLIGKNKGINRLKLLINLVLYLGVINGENIKIKKSI